MKNLLLILFLCLFYSCNYNTKTIEDSSGVFPAEETINGMRYRTYRYYQNSICVVNVTKDSLECEFYKQYLEPIKKKE